MFLHIKLRKRRIAKAPRLPGVNEAAPQTSSAEVAHETPPLPAVATPTQSGARIKTYFADNVRDAMQMASRDLGDEAVLIESIPSDGHPEGRFRVTCGGPPSSGDFQELLRVQLRGGNPQQSELARLAADDPGPAGETRNDSELRTEMESLREDFETLRTLVFRNHVAASAETSVLKPGNSMISALVSQGIDPEVAAQWVLSASTDISDDKAPASSLVRHLAQTIETDDSLERPVIFVGPPGSGKTTALLKLALEYGVRRGRSVQIVTLGNEPNGKLASIAGLMDIPTTSVLAAEALHGVLDATVSKDVLTLVDPGACLGTHHEEPLVGVIRDLSPAVHLTLPATWSRASLQRAMERFEVFSPSHVLFTMMDETPTPAAILESAWKTGKKLSFFNSGPIGRGPIAPAGIAALLSGLAEPSPEQTPIEAGNR